MYWVHISTLLLVCILQFFNTMIVTGFLLSFVVASTLIMYIQVALYIFVLILHCTFVSFTTMPHHWQQMHYVRPMLSHSLPLVSLDVTKLCNNTVICNMLLFYILLVATSWGLHYGPVFSCNHTTICVFMCLLVFTLCHITKFVVPSLQINKTTRHYKVICLDKRENAK